MRASPCSPRSPRRLGRPRGARPLASLAVCLCLLTALVGCALPAGSARTADSTSTPTATPPTPVPTPESITFTPFAPLRAGIYSAAVGPDGNLWYTLPDRIGRVTPAGAYRTMAQPGGGGYGLRGGAGKLLWFINRPGGAFALARLTMSGALQTVPLPPGFSLNPADMAAEPDGTLWFFGQYPIFVNAAGDGRMSSAFGRVTPAGTLTLFPTGVDNLTSDGRLPSLAVGADGYLWFVGYRVTFHFPKSGSGTATPIGGYLARISSTGTVRPVPLPATTDGLFVFDAVAGPDGTVWCVVGGNGAMASRALLAVAPTGGIRTFPLPADGNAPDSLVVGPDGTIWFTEIPYGQEGALIAVGRLTPTGSLTEFPLPRHNPQGEFPSAAGNPSDMVLGADGNIWFTERLYGMIGQITPRGDISEFHMRDSSYAVTLIGQLLAGTDHALWYTVNYYQDAASAPVASVVGRITM